MTLLRLREFGPQWPYSVAQFRADEPSLSISSDPHPGELASYATLEPPILIYQVQPSDQPEHDPATHRAQEITPVEIDGTWRQAWELIELPPPPPVEPPQPRPDWPTFKAAAVNSTSLKAIVSQAIAIEPVAALFVMEALGKCEADTTACAEFGGLWAVACKAADVPPEVIAGFQAVASQCHLPAEFVQALSPE